MVGTTISHYGVLEKLGGGGMGVVYRAEDLKLRRPVALKFLPPDLTRDDEARQRFTLEAQAASALDHPNICTIHEIDATPDGQMFLVMAYYSGETLKRKIERSPLKLDDALDYAIQIAQGLVKAHAAGIVHRDIKPANVMITNDGLVKIVDFGLAKLLGQTGVTRTGTTLGTVAYMSPEQIAGLDVDARSDIWSLGVLLYETIAGQLPFKGDTQPAVTHAIVSTAPTPLTALRSGVPMDLERIVNRALAKQPGDRYQTAADFLSELRRLKRETDSQPPNAAVTMHAITARHNNRRMVVLAVAGVLLLAVVGYVALARRMTTSSVPQLTNPVQVAASIGVEIFPSWSPDGHMLVYQSDQAGNDDIWVTQIGGGPPVNRTADYLGADAVPRWSPDGRQIAFWSARDGGGIFVMPALAGGARKVAPGLSTPAPAAWSPDGSELAYPANDGGKVWLERLNLQNGTRRRAVLPAGVGAPLDFTWSPDGQFVAFVGGGASYTSQVTRIWVLRLNDAKAAGITDGLWEEWSPSWSPDARTLFFTSNRGRTRDVWEQPLSDQGAPIGEAQRVTTSVDVLQASVSSDGRRVAYAKGRKVANVWRVPILPDRAATWADARQVTFDQAYIEFFDLSPDGERLAVQSDRSGNPDLWILPSSGGEMQQLTSDPTPDWAPAWSPDGREMAFYAFRSGQREVWIQSVGGGPARQLTNFGGAFPRWAPNGTTIFFLSGLNEIWAVPPAGGEPHRVRVSLRSTSQFVAVSPDGRWFAVASDRDPNIHAKAPMISSPSVENRIWRVRTTGDEVEAMTKTQTSQPEPRWSPDGKAILFSRAGNIWRVAVDSKSERGLTNLGGKRGSLGSSIASDGKYLYFTWREDIADIWVMDVVRRGR